MSLGTTNNIKKKDEKTSAGFYCSNTLEIDKLVIQNALKKHEVGNVSPRLPKKKTINVKRIKKFRVSSKVNFEK
jgi:non-canonical (house-cleaning) NTP pyrophosphatase